MRFMMDVLGVVTQIRGQYLSPEQRLSISSLPCGCTVFSGHCQSGFGRRSVPEELRHGTYIFAEVSKAYSSKL